MKKNRLIVTALASACLALVGCASDTKTADADGADKAMGTFNTTCPYSNGPVKPEAGTVAVAGKSIGFCCAGCKGKFEALDPSKQAEMVSTMSKAK